MCIENIFAECTHVSMAKRYTVRASASHKSPRQVTFLYHFMCIHTNISVLSLFRSLSLPPSISPTHLSLVRLFRLVDWLDIVCVFVCNMSNFYLASAFINSNPWEFTMQRHLLNSIQHIKYNNKQRLMVSMEGVSSDMINNNNKKK